MSQAHEHLVSMLWGQANAHVHAFIRGDVVKDLRQRLREAELKDWDCLLRGALSPDVQARAPYVVDLVRGAAFTNWLLTEAHVAYPNWGFLGVSTEPLLEARELGRSLMRVSLPGGEVRTWNWVDPELWCNLLPKLDSAQLQAAYGCMTDWVRITDEQWQWYTHSAGQLSTSVRPAPQSAV